MIVFSTPIHTFSDSESNADVASSSNKIDGFRTNALAIATRCFWPPDNWVPFSPTRVWYPFVMNNRCDNYCIVTAIYNYICTLLFTKKLQGKYNTWGRDAMNEWILARLAASTTSSIETSLSLSPYWIFSARVLSNKTGS